MLDLVRARVIGGLVAVMLACAACGGGGGNSGGGGGNGGGGGGGTQTATTPTISTQPQSTSVAQGTKPTLTVAATGNGTLSYQWRLNGTAIAGATSASLAFTAGVKPSDAGAYDVVVTNSLNGTTANATSTAANLTVVVAPASPDLVADKAVKAGTPAHQASITAPGTDTSITWTVRNGTITAGQGTSTITYTAGTAGRATITAQLSNLAGTATRIRNVWVVADVPVASIFAQASVLPGTQKLKASTPQAVGQTFSWSLQNGTASGTLDGGQTTPIATYSVGSTPGSYQLSVSVTDPIAGQSSINRTLSVVQNAWVKPPEDSVARTLHTATLLTDGRVLVVGGDAGIPTFGTYTIEPGTQSNVVASAEWFDPATKQFAVVGSLNTARFGHTATLLNDGRVLVAGGANSSTPSLASAEIYDPTQRTWTAAASMATGRTQHTAVMLENGRVLVIGGKTNGGVTATAEIYDPIANAWTSAGTMRDARILHSTTVMANGKVLVAGGRDGSQVLSTADIYDPSANSWSAAADLPAAINGQASVLLVSGSVLQLGLGSTYDPASNTWAHSTCVAPGAASASGTSALLLSDGRVLAVGGFFIASGPALYDPQTQCWSDAGTIDPDAIAAIGLMSSATLLDNDQVLIVDGMHDNGNTVETDIFESIGASALYDATARTFEALGTHAHGGRFAAATSLAGGQIVFTGGSLGTRGGNVVTALAAADVFDPADDSWKSVAPMKTARERHTASSLSTGSVLVVGGTNAAFDLFSSAERYDPVADTWTAAGSLSVARHSHTASVLNSGKVLVVGGRKLTCNCTTFIEAAEIYDPSANSWSLTSPLATGRYSHTATVLANGKVLVAGGFGGPPSTLQDGGAVLSSTEIYDPATGLWSAGAPMLHERRDHTATLLPSGRVLVTGGTGSGGGPATLASAEIYDPVGNSWSAAASMSTARTAQRAALLPDGNVLVVGGLNDVSSPVIGVKTAEVYDVGGNSWSPAGSLNTPRQQFVLSLLPDGRAMIVGGLHIHAGLPEFYE